MRILEAAFQRLSAGVPEGEVAVIAMIAVWLSWDERLPGLGRLLRLFLECFEVRAGLAQSFFGQLAGRAIAGKLAGEALDGGDVLPLVVNHFLHEKVERQKLRVGEIHGELTRVGRPAAVEDRFRHATGHDLLVGDDLFQHR